MIWLLKLQEAVEGVEGQELSSLLKEKAVFAYLLFMFRKKQGRDRDWALVGSYRLILRFKLLFELKRVI